MARTHQMHCNSTVHITMTARMAFSSPMFPIPARAVSFSLKSAENALTVQDMTSTA